VAAAKRRDLTRDDPDPHPVQEGQMAYRVLATRRFPFFRSHHSVFSEINALRTCGYRSSGEPFRKYPRKSDGNRWKIPSYTPYRHGRSSAEVERRCAALHEGSHAQGATDQSRETPSMPVPQQPTAAELTRPFRAVPASEPARDQSQPTSSAATRFVIRRGPGAGNSYAITQPTTTLGRYRDCDIVLDDVTVSRHHATLHFEDGQYSITDSGSLNGIYVNQRPTEQGDLSDGDEVWIGKFRLTFRTAAP
jgi:hypothetical protein